MTVIGTGDDIGREVVEELLRRDHEALAFVSEPSPVPGSWGRRVQVVSGQLTDPAGVAATIDSGQAVVNAVDPRLGSPGVHLVQGATHVVAAMRDHGARRSVGLGSPAVRLCPRERTTVWVRAHRAVLRFLHPRVHGQTRQMMATVTGADLDRTIVRFLRPTPGRGLGLKYVGYFGHDAVGSCAAAGDIAALAVTQLLDARHITDAPAVSNRAAQRSGEQRPAGRSPRVPQEGAEAGPAAAHDAHHPGPAAGAAGTGVAENTAGAS